MRQLFQTVTDLAAQADIVRGRRYGVIEAVDGELRAIHLRPFPKRVTFVGATLLGAWQHRLRTKDHCLIYYNQPRRHSQVLAVTYMLTGRGTRLATIRKALAVLEEIARLKGVDALLCDVSNRRISDRLMAREGWQFHFPSLLHRHYIKRFWCPEATQEPVPAGLPLVADAWQIEGTSGLAV